MTVLVLANILTIDQPTIAGRIYPKDVAEKIVEDIKNFGGFVTEGFPSVPNVIPAHQILGKVRSAEIVGDDIHALLDIAKLPSVFDANDYRFKMFGTGSIQAGATVGQPYIVESYTFSGIAAIKKVPDEPQKTLKDVKDSLNKKLRF